MDDVIIENVKKSNEIAFEAKAIAEHWIKSKGWDCVPANKGRFKYLIAKNGDEKKVVIVKGTTGSKNNFGAVTLTAFKVIIEHNNNCIFLLVDITIKDPMKCVNSFKLEEILHHMFIPPFKIDFVVNAGNNRNIGKGVDLEDIKKLIKYYDRIKAQSIK